MPVWASIELSVVLFFTGVNSEVSPLYRKLRYKENSNRQSEAKVINLKVCFPIRTGLRNLMSKGLLSVQRQEQKYVADL